MTITLPVYAQREMIKRALDIADTARANDQVDRLLQSTSRSIDGDLKRVFYPRFQTLKWDWISSQSPTPWRLWLDDKELISASLVVSGAETVTHYFLYPDNGPPYNRLEVDISSNSAFTLANTHQKAISITGVYGYTLDLLPIGTLSADITSSDMSISVSNGAACGVGDLLVVGTEYVLVTERSWLTTGQLLQTPLSANSANTVVAVVTGSAFNQGETILIDGEVCWITAVAGNNLIVRRAWDGTTLATHTGSLIYVSRTLSVLRGVVGSPAASHTTGAQISRWSPPFLLTQRCVAETLAALEQEKSGYARVVGSGDHTQEAKGTGLADIRDLTMTTLGRKMRTRVV